MQSKRITQINAPLAVFHPKLGARNICKLSERPLSSFFTPLGNNRTVTLASLRIGIHHLVQRFLGSKKINDDEEKFSSDSSDSTDTE